MNVKFPKSYVFVGTLLTAGVIAVVGYNNIMANNIKEISTQSSDNVNIVQSSDSLQEQIDELKIVLDQTQNKVTELEEKIKILEEENTSKDLTISSLQSKTNKIQTSVNNTYDFSELETIRKNIAETNSNIGEINVKNGEQEELLKEKEKLEEEYNILWGKACNYIDLTEKYNNLNREIYILKVSTPASLDIEKATKQIEEWQSIVDSTQNKKEKEYYINAIKELKNKIEVQKNYNKKLEELENQIDSLGNIDDSKPTEQEEKRRIEISEKIGQINEELLKY